MPRLPIDYSKTLIYKLVQKDDFNNENIYIGSTTNFTRRKNEHKQACINSNSNDYNTVKSKYIRNNGGWENWLMLELEKYPCNDKNEAKVRERYWIEFFKSNLNTNIPSRQRDEYIKKYRQNNKEKIKESGKIYRKNNEQTIKEKKNIKAKEKVKCDKCGSEVTCGYLKTHQKTKKCQIILKKEENE